MVLAGKGCALASTGEQPSLIEALDCYTRSKQLAEAQGMATQVEFMESLIVGVTKALRLAEAHAIDDGGVIERVTDDGVFGAE